MATRAPPSQRWCGSHPKPGFFGYEVRLPVDANLLLAAIAPRPMRIVQPTMDRDATPASVHAAVEHARKAYAAAGATDKLALGEPSDYQRFPAATQTSAIDWLKAQS